MPTHHLVIQSPALSAAQTEQLAALAQAQGVMQLGATAARLLDVGQDDALRAQVTAWGEQHGVDTAFVPAGARLSQCRVLAMDMDRSEEHTSELQSLMRISYAVFCLKKKINS